MNTIIKKIFQISIFSLILLLILFGLNKNIVSTNIAKSNADYKKIDIIPISQVGVAITTNIGIGGIRNNNFDETNINTQVFKIEDFYNGNPNINKKLIKNNMIFTKEYYSILKSNFNNILKKSRNREQTLKNLTKQLKIRYKNASQNLLNLRKQKSILLTEYETINTKIDTLKRNLENNFNKNLVEKVFKNVDDYYTLKQYETIIKTNIIFINNFLKKYLALNKYNEELITTLELNKDILSKKSYLVVPKNGTKILKDFDLLYDEKEYKEKILKK